MQETTAEEYGMKAEKTKEKEKEGDLEKTSI